MEVRQTRHQEIKLIKYDDPFSNIRYTGRSSSMRGLDSEPIWQILREYKDCATGITVSTYANMGEFNCVWNDRTTYFPAVTGSNACSLSNVSISGQVIVSGLSIGGKITYVTLNDTTWTKLPAVHLAERNAISIQNQSATEIKIEYDNTVVGYSGVTIRPDGERFYEIRDVPIYAKCQTGTCVILVEELA